MTTINIKRNGNTAKIFLQKWIVGGTVIDKDGNVTFISTSIEENENGIENFFNKAKQETGLQFFNEKHKEVA